MRVVPGIIFLTIFWLSATMVSGNAEERAQYAAVPNAGMSNLLPVPKPPVSLDLRDIDVKDAFRFLAEKANLNIVPTNQVAGRVSLKVDNAPVADVFELLIRSNGLAYEKIGTIYNVMTEKEYRERYGRAFDDIREVQVFRLKYVVPDQAFEIVNSLKSSVGKALVDADAGTITVMDTPEQLDRIRATLNELEYKTSVRIFPLRYARAEEVARHLKSQVDNLKIGTVKADDRTNQVVVRTLPERMEEIAKVIEGLDQKTREVLIDARIIQVKLSDSLSAGVQWEGLFNLSKKYGTTYLGSYPFSAVQSTTSAWRSRQQVFTNTGYIGSYPFSGTTTNQSAGSSRVGSEQMHIGVIGKNDYDVVVNYLKTLGNVKILSNPKLAVTNNQEARIHVGERTAYITTTTTAGQTTTTVSEQVTFLDVGLQLFITPTINDDGFITLQIKPEVSSVIGEVLTAQNNKIPVVDTSTAETTVMVKDGTTVAVGGLRRDEKSGNAEQVPFLGRIPVVGALFRQEQKDVRHSELLILVSAKVIQGDELDTGNSRSDFGEHLGQAYKDYLPFTRESDIEAPGVSSGDLREKSYRDYPAFRDESDNAATVKPMR